MQGGLSSRGGIDNSRFGLRGGFRGRESAMGFGRGGGRAGQRGGESSRGGGRLELGGGGRGGRGGIAGTGIGPLTLIGSAKKVLQNVSGMVGRESPRSRTMLIC
jgi:hypothetical protein